MSFLCFFFFVFCVCVYLMFSKDIATSCKSTFMQSTANHQTIAPDMALEVHMGELRLFSFCSLPVTNNYALL
uniref:Putative secreted protein n=1 Tax=Anopheles darlingi TaxID=43151 RepID=A0A2M4D4C2_ANODA